MLPAGVSFAIRYSINPAAFRSFLTLLSLSLSLSVPTLLSEEDEARTLSRPRPCRVRVCAYLARRSYARRARIVSIRRALGESIIDPRASHANRPVVCAARKHGPKDKLGLRLTTTAINRLRADGGLTPGSRSLFHLPHCRENLRPRPSTGTAAVSRQL